MGPMGLCRESATHRVALLLQAVQPGAEVEGGQRLRCRVEAVQVPPLQQQQQQQQQRSNSSSRVGAQCE